MLRGFLALTLLLGATAAPAAYAKSCRDTTTGKFTKCEKPKPVKCRDEKGKFTKCKADVSAKAENKTAPAATPSDGAPGKN